MFDGNPFVHVEIPELNEAVHVPTGLVATKTQPNGTCCALELYNNAECNATQWVDTFLPIASRSPNPPSHPLHHLNTQQLQPLFDCPGSQVAQ